VCRWLLAHSPLITPAVFRRPAAALRVAFRVALEPKWLASTDSWNRPAFHYEHPQPPPPNNVMNISAITTVGDQQVRPTNCLWDGAVLLM